MSFAKETNQTYSHENILIDLLSSRDVTMFGEAAARRELFSQVSGLVGSDGSEAIRALVSAARRKVKRTSLPRSRLSYENTPSLITASPG
jgi:hypothetical protein